MNKKILRSIIIFFVCLLALSISGKTGAVHAYEDQQFSLQGSVILVSTDIITDTTWVSGNVYYIQNNIEVKSGVTLTIEGGTIVKFRVPYDPATQALTGLTVNGALRFTNTGPEDIQRVTFTSGRDDTFGGDTNGDGTQTQPAAGDWNSVRLTKWADTDPSYQYLTFRYSKDGLNFHNATSTTVSPVFEDNMFVENTCGLTLWLTSNGNIEGQVNRNIFTGNRFGFCARRTAGLGQNNPTLTENNFNNNKMLPIYLYGTSFPTYVNNTFSGYIEPGDKLGVGLAGEFNGSGTLTVVNDMPFVILSPMYIQGTGVNVTIPAGAIFKSYTRYDLANPTDLLPGLRVYADVTFEATEIDPIIFTSYRDDTFGGDTNGDGVDTEPYPADWAGLLYVDSRAPTDANLTFQHLTFRYAINGLLYQTTTTVAGGRAPIISDSKFEYNQNGLRFRAVSNNLNSRIEPTIQNSSFTGQGIIPAVKTDVEPGVPVMLENTVEPTFSNNTFSENLHPAIGLVGRWRGTVVLPPVAGQGLSQLPYLVHGDFWLGDANIPIGVDSATNLTIPQGVVFKFFVNNFDRNTRSRLLGSGRLTLENLLAGPYIFTSYYDDEYGGDTDGGTAIAPAARDWGSVVIRHPDSAITYSTFRYGDKALHVQNRDTTAGAPFDAEISHSIFEYNDYGLYLDIQATNDITSLISNNIFQFNSVGLGTFALSGSNGLSQPVWRENIFQASTLFPLYLNGSATLEFYEPSNELLNNSHTAIALGGYHGAVKDDPGYEIILPRIYEGPESPKSELLVPYVVWDNANFDSQTSTWIDGGLIFKFNAAKSLHFFGQLTMNTSVTDGNVFTSYKDDTHLGDTNGDGNSTLPARRNWGGLYLYNPNTPGFSYSTFNYSADGLVLFQKSPYNLGSNLAIPVTHNRFEENGTGLKFLIASNNDITSPVEYNIFTHNDYGFNAYTTLDPSYPNHCGTSDPTLTQNEFSHHSAFPLYLKGSSNPTYVGNTFTANDHPAIAVGGIWCRDATWSKVYDDTFGQDMPYVVTDNLLQEHYYTIPPTITLPDSLVVKFTSAVYIYAYGYLEMLSEPGKEVIFTAYADDSFAGDINGDGPPASIPRTAWKTVWVMDYPGKINQIHDLKVYYATSGLGLYYEGPENTQTATKIWNAEFGNSFSGLALVIGWRQIGSTINPGAGNINAELQNIAMHDSSYGILTVAHDKSIGIVKPSLQNVTFTDITYYPIFLGGTSYFSYVADVEILASPDAASAPSALSGVDALNLESNETTGLTLEGFDLPGNREVLDSIEPGKVTLQSASAPLANLTAALDLSPAIAIAGAWNNAGELAKVEGVPYAVVGGFPLTMITDNFTYKPADNVTIGAVNAGNAQVSVPAGTVFKFSKDRLITVYGTFNLLSTPSQPVIFTSIKDDSAAGDTNRDGPASLPSAGDWGEIRLASTNNFHNAVVRYATKGLHIYFTGLVNQNNASSVAESTFMKNIRGVSLTTLDNGDIFSSINDSTFTQNTIHIQGNSSNVGKTGHLCIDAHDNDLFGDLNQNGIENNNLNGHSVVIPGCDPNEAFDATNNYWGHETGPNHPSLNPEGLGSKVSDRVLFDPWRTEPVNPPATYTISGRITKETAVGEGLAGVKVRLQTESQGDFNTVTDSEGYYSFSGLQNGRYLVTPSLSGYLFTPSVLDILLGGFDGTDSNFIATISPGGPVFSVNDVNSLRPLSSTITQYCTFTVSLNMAPDPSANPTVDYATSPGTANATTDYVHTQGKLTFSADGSLSQQVAVPLRVTDLDDPDKYFYLILNNPVHGTLGYSTGVCTIKTTRVVFLPLITK